jgi:hypothetical protein
MTCNNGGSGNPRPTRFVNGGRPKPKGAPCKDCPDFVSVAVTADVPTLIMAAGVITSYFNPSVGVPIGLSGAILEVCPLTGNPLCILAKFSSVGGVATVDKYLNIYAGAQYSFGKSAISPIGVSINPAAIITEDGHRAKEDEIERFASGFSVSAGSVLTGGVMYSPSENRSAGYLVIPPELASANFSFSGMLYDAHNNAPIW